MASFSWALEQLKAKRLVTRSGEVTWITLSSTEDFMLWAMLEQGPRVIVATYALMAHEILADDWELA